MMKTKPLLFLLLDIVEYALFYCIKIKGGINHFLDSLMSVVFLKMARFSTDVRMLFQ